MSESATVFSVFDVDTRVAIVINASRADTIDAILNAGVTAGCAKTLLTQAEDGMDGWPPAFER